MKFNKQRHVFIFNKPGLVIVNKLGSMVVFVRVVDGGSFSAAAEEMRVSGTMVRPHIKTLEEYLGVRLLNRATRRQSLTDFGQGYYQSCRRILADIEDSESQTFALHQKPHGKLRVGCPVSFGVHALSPVTAQFLAEWTDMAVDLVLSDKSMDMADESLNVMAKIGELLHVNTLVTCPIAPYRSVMCASPAYIKQVGEPITPEELCHHRCLGFAHPIATNEWTLQGEGKPVRAPVNITMACNSGETLRGAALNGLGTIMQPEILLVEDLQYGRPPPLMSEFQPLAKPVHVLTFTDRQQLPKIRLYVDFLLKNFSTSLYALNLE